MKTTLPLNILRAANDTHERLPTPPGTRGCAGTLLMTISCLGRFSSKAGFMAGLMFASTLAAQTGGRSTISSADGRVQIQTDFPGGKVTILRPTPLEMQVIRKQAESGYAPSQMILSQVQYALKNADQGERWLRLAAQSGNMFAEYTLGFRLALDKTTGARNPPEGVTWLKVAAYEGYAGAQSDLALCYRKGIGIPASTFEAYKWFLISRRSWPSRRAGTKNAWQLSLESALTSEQIERAKTQAGEFRPMMMERNPFVDSGFITLEAISASDGRPISVINGTAFTTGEQKKVKVLSTVIEVRCLKIEKNSVIISSSPYWQRGEMRLMR